MFAAQHISYSETTAFSSIVLDYLQGVKDLQPYYIASPDLSSIKKLIEQKGHQKVDRDALVAVLQKQYNTVDEIGNVEASIGALRSSNTFTVCTAHQPNLFTGPLYFFYKIIHVIKLADALKRELPDYNFVPVYYMGSEDADLAELNHFTIEGKKYEWQTSQTGAVGRMKVDSALINILNELQGQLETFPHGREWVSLLKKYFTIGVLIQDATFHLVHDLFSSFGLVVLIADDPMLKNSMQPVFEQDLFEHTPSAIVSETSKKLNQQYEAQAYPRDINLFYLKDEIRERIERNGDNFRVCNTSLQFTEEEIRKELKNHPERFSPNVILRGLYQETILPNVIFVGGGGEVAYWLQLKNLFDHFNVQFPILVLRNSFLIVERKWAAKIDKLGLTYLDIFQPADDILKKIIERDSTQQLTLNGKLEEALALYESIGKQASSVDASLSQHVKALQVQAIQKLQNLEKKMLRAEKRKFTDAQRQIVKIKEGLFPKNGLQERTENIGYYYSKWGRSFIKMLYDHSLSLEQQFTILKEETA